MPSPVGSSPSPVTIPPVEIDGGAASAAPRSPEPGGVVTIPPVCVEGQAESAARIVREHDAAKAARSCAGESVTAAYGAIEVAGAVGGTILGAALGPAGVAVGLAAVAGLSYSEGQKVRALYNCLTE